MYKGGHTQISPIYCMCFFYLWTQQFNMGSKLSLRVHVQYNYIGLSKSIALVFHMFQEVFL